MEEGREMQDLIEVLEVAEQYRLRVVIDSGMTVGYIGRQSDLDALIDDIDMEIVDY